MSEVILAEHNYYVKDVFRNSNMQYVKDVIGYIDGSIVRKLQSVITCKICLEQIIARTPLSALQKKCRGGLKSASSDVIRICEMAEKQFRLVNITRKDNVLKYLMVMTFRNISPSILSSNSEHIFDQEFLDRHRTHAIKLIIFKYLSI